METVSSLIFIWRKNTPISVSLLSGQGNVELPELDCA
jgi:hypothetical protein